MSILAIVLNIIFAPLYIIAAIFVLSCVWLLLVSVYALVYYSIVAVLKGLIG